ncbi:uncharacterized protein [Euphorbia lathyris]|uniref:uncharacterized protein n=1 Tax=Euphorbia lathyris TaxID=212925 RepID=UPI00331386D5
MSEMMQKMVIGEWREGHIEDKVEKKVEEERMGENVEDEWMEEHIGDNVEENDNVEEKVGEEGNIENVEEKVVEDGKGENVEHEGKGENVEEGWEVIQLGDDTETQHMTPKEDELKQYQVRGRGGKPIKEVQTKKPSKSVKTPFTEGKKRKGSEKKSNLEKMKKTKDEQLLLWNHTVKTNPTPIVCTIPKIMLTLLLFLGIFTPIYYSLNLLYPQNPPNQHPNFISVHRIPCLRTPPNTTTRLKTTTQPKTALEHVVFGIAASSTLWERRKNYIKTWWKPGEMRGVVWLDNEVKNEEYDDILLPPTMISSDVSEFPYENRNGDRSAIRISRIVSETLKLGMENVRWFVMGDDDTVFIPDNLVRVLSKYDHNQYYYIGSISESHIQNIHFSYGMAYGGGGFAVSFPLAKALAKMQDRCIRRYPSLYGSDDRIQACMAELGVPLTREAGFHQFDVYGNAFGLLAAHPVAPIVSLHHIDIIEPIFPGVDRVEALRKLQNPIKLDSAALMQQTICYDPTRKWTISVSWGFAVQIIRGIVSAREIERPARTFLNWYKTADQSGFATNTRPVSKNTCQRPFVYALSYASYIGSDHNQTVSEYVGNGIPNPRCGWKVANPSQIQRVVVYKTPDPNLWDKAPRRKCCRVLPIEEKGSLVVDVGECREDEVIETL